MDKFRSIVNAATGEFLWAAILVPILAISWVGFFTIARSIGIPPIFAAGMSAAFDGIALFAARIGLKHRRKGFSGYLARVTVILFAALGAFVQSFHAESQAWIHAHSWIVWATAPIAACIAYELHLGWVHRKQLIRKGYHHPSAKSGFGPATWIHFPRGTFSEYRTVLRARRAYIARVNIARFETEEAAQPKLAPIPARTVPAPARVEAASPSRPARTTSDVVPTTPRPSLHSVPVRRPAGRKVARDQNIRDWVVDNGYSLGSKGRVPIDGLRAYRAAHPQQRSA
jgi:hypothetical protein